MRYKELLWFMVAVIIMAVVIVVPLVMSLNFNTQEVPPRLDKDWHPNAIILNGQWIYDAEVTWTIDQVHSDWLLVRVEKEGNEPFYEYVMVDDFITAIVRKG